MENTLKFPHPTYSRTVLEPAFTEAKSHYYKPMLQANRAHAVMLYQSGVISKDNAATLLKGLRKIRAEGVSERTYQPGVEDLFFAIEQRLIALIGEKFGGNLQLARSRNDLGYTLTRMAIREDLLELGDLFLKFRKVLLDTAQDHLETLMPGYTHTQPAQPTTMAHYLAGVLESLERFFDRYQLVYSLNNQSPLGAAALTGTGFAIDRDLSARLLGFDKVIRSTQDSIGAGDNLTDLAGWLSGWGVFLSRMTKDFIFWCTQESGALRIDDSFIQISSIMPQKRNPVVIEHLRARLSRMIGLAYTITLQCHSIPYGDTQDVEDEIGFSLFNAAETGKEILALYADVIRTMTVNREHLSEKARGAFITVTELADTLVRELKIPFRQAHHIVSRLVQFSQAQNLDISEIPIDKFKEEIAEISGEVKSISAALIESALDARRFVEKRVGLGGAAVSATQAILKTTSIELEKDQAYYQGLKQTLDDAAAMLDDMEAQILT
jgi:argininosuccinate lyase